MIQEWALWSSASYTVSVACGHRHKVPLAGAQFWELEIQDEGVVGALPPPKALAKRLSQVPGGSRAVATELQSIMEFSACVWIKFPQVEGHQSHRIGVLLCSAMTSFEVTTFIIALSPSKVTF